MSESIGRNGVKCMLRCFSIGGGIHLTVVLLVILFVASTLLPACIAEPAGVETPLAPVIVELPASETAGAPADVNPEVLFQALDDEPSLEQAAAQIASEVAVQPEAIRARVRVDGCTVCDAQVGMALGTLEGLSIAEAASIVEAGGTLWLFVGKLTCEYAYDGAFYRPKGCQQSSS